MATGATTALAVTGGLSAYQAWRSGEEASKQAKKQSKAAKAAMEFQKQRYGEAKAEWEKAFAPIMNLTPEQLAARNAATVEQAFSGASTKAMQQLAQRGLTGSGAEAELLADIERKKAEARSKAEAEAPFSLSQMKGKALSMAPSPQGVAAGMGGLANLYGSRSQALLAQSGQQWGTAGTLAGLALAYDNNEAEG